MSEKRIPSEHELPLAIRTESLEWHGDLYSTFTAAISDIEWSEQYEAGDRSPGARAATRIGRFVLGAMQSRGVVYEKEIPISYEYGYVPLASYDFGGTIAHLNSSATASLTISESRINGGINSIRGKGDTPTLLADLVIARYSLPSELPELPPAEDGMGRYIHEYGTWRLISPRWLRPELQRTVHAPSTSYGVSVKKPGYQQAYERNVTDKLEEALFEAGFVK